MNPTPLQGGTIPALNSESFRRRTPALRAQGRRGGASLHGVRIGDTQAAHELGLDAHLTDTPHRQEERQEVDIAYVCIHIYIYIQL